MNEIMNPAHRSEANYILDWFNEAGKKILNEYKDLDTFRRFFDVGLKTHRWDYYTFLDDVIVIGWKDVSYEFVINTTKNFVKRI